MTPRIHVLVHVVMVQHTAVFHAGAACHTVLVSAVVLFVPVLLQCLENLLATAALALMLHAIVAAVVTLVPHRG